MSGLNTLPLRQLRLLLAAAFLSVCGCSGSLFLESPIPPDTCSSDSECPTGQRCANNECIDASTPCSIWIPDGVCPASLLCCDGVCAGVTTCDDFCNCQPDESCQGGQCVVIETDDRCSAFNIDGICPGTEVCVRGQCVPCDPSNTCSASVPNGCCPAGNICASGVCRPEDEVPEELCSAMNPDGACPPGQVCNAGTCELAPCSAQVPTGFCTSLGEACIDGSCQPLPCSPTQPSGVCENSNQFCSAAGQCIDNGTCAANADCLSGERCSAANQCIGTGACLVDADCGPFDRCDNMMCVRDFACATDTDCLDTEFCSIMLQCVPDGDCLDTADCAMGQFCSAADTCINDGTCLQDGDCTNPQVCGVSQVCLNPGDCAQDEDCLPGRTCTAPSCDVAPSDLCTVNKAVDDPCPGGETCCDEGLRCSAADSNGDRACILDGQCVDDSDCLNDGMTQWYTCNTDTNQCEPVTTCMSSAECGMNERCSINGACIPDTGCAQDSDCTPGQVCNALFECEATMGCGSEEFETTLVEPNMLIVLDRSGSMRNAVGACSSGTNSRWNIARNSLSTVMAANQDTIQFGLSTYPYYCPGIPVCGITDCGNNCTSSCNWGNACDTFDGSDSEEACNVFPGCEWTGSTCAVRDPSLDAEWAATCALMANATYTDSTVCDAFPMCSWDGDSCEPVYNQTGDNRVPGDVDVSVGPLRAAAIDAILEPPTTTEGTQHPGGFTPTDRALRLVASDRARFNLPDPADMAPRDNFVMLVTDGDANNNGGSFGGVCDGNSATWNPGDIYGTFDNDGERVNCAVDYLRQGTGGNEPARTFVVGFAGGSPEFLNCHAVWGGTSRCGTTNSASAPDSLLAPRCVDLTTEAECEGGCTWGGSSCSGPAGCDAYTTQDTCEDAGWPGCSWSSGSCGGGIDGTNCDTDTLTCYFSADNASELSDAFTDIAGAVAACSFTLDQAVTDLDQLFVFVEYTAPPNTVQLGRVVNNPDGWWSFDSMTERLTIEGQACDDVQNGLATPKVVFGCGGGG